MKTYRTFDTKKARKICRVKSQPGMMAFAGLAGSWLDSVRVIYKNSEFTKRPINVESVTLIPKIKIVMADGKTFIYDCFKIITL
jgi:hypothetical protein